MPAASDKGHGMPLLDWLRDKTTPAKTPRDPLDDALQRASKATAEALDVVNESRRRRGAPVLSWEDLIAQPTRHERQHREAL